MLAASSPAFAQRYIDASNWLANDYVSNKPGHLFYLGFNVQRVSGPVISDAYYFERDTPFAIGSESYLLGTPLYTMTSPPGYAGGVLIEENGVSILAFSDGRATLIINRGDQEYRAKLSAQNEGYHELQLGFIGTYYFQYYSFSLIAPTESSLAKLDALEGPLVGGDGAMESLLVPLERLAMLMQELILLEREHSELHQYSVGLLSILSGMVLGSIFLFGLKLR